MFRGGIFGRGFCASALTCGLVFANIVPAAAQDEERDNATLRRLALQQWYNETAPAPTPDRGRHRGPFSPAYQRFLNDAAARERARYGAQLPTAGVTGAVDPSAAVGATTAGTWTNIGPTKADVLTNGGVTLQKTDTGRVRTILTDPANTNTIYVAFAAGGVWKSVDGGISWAAKTDTLGTLSCGALAMDPTNSATLYLGLGDPFDGTGVGLVKSIDGGDTWSAPVYLGTSTSIPSLVVAPSAPNVVLAATDKGLFRSVDAGATFAQVNVGGAAPHVWNIEWAGDTKFVASLEANPSATSGTTDGQVWYSADNGATWTRAAGMTKSTGVGRITIAAAPSTRSIMYAMAAIPNSSSSGDLADFFKSTNGGASWTALGISKKRYINANTESRTVGTLLNGQGWYNALVIVDPSNANVAYFGGALLLARTSDGGSSYRQMTNWLAQFGLPYVHADFHAAHFDANAAMYVGTDGGIFKSTDAGATWTDALNVGITSHLFYSVGSSPANPDAVVGGLQDNGTRVRFSNSSIFNQEIGGDGFGSDINPINANLMLGSLYYARVYKSTNGGSTFTQSCSGIVECNNASSAPFLTRIIPWRGDTTGQTVFTFVNLKVYKSTTYASSWSALGTAGLPTTSFNIRNFGIATTNPNRMGIVANGGRVYLSSNGGASWAATPTTPINNGLSLSSIWFDDSTSAIYVTSVAPDATKTHVWKTTDEGMTWTTIDGGGFPTGVPVNAIVKVGTSLYAATHLGAYVSADDGASWSRWGNGLPLVNVFDVNFTNNSLVRAASYGRGVWEIIP